MVILGIVLVLAGAGLLVAEAHLPTYGLLGLAGVVSLVAGGALALDRSGGGPLGALGGGLVLAVVVGLVLALVAGTALVAAVRGVASVSRRRAHTGAEGLVGQL